VAADCTTDVPDREYGQSRARQDRSAGTQGARFAAAGSRRGQRRRGAKIDALVLERDAPMFDRRFRNPEAGATRHQQPLDTFPHDRAFLAHRGECRQAAGRRTYQLIMFDERGIAEQLCITWPAWQIGRQFRSKRLGCLGEKPECARKSPKSIDRAAFSRMLSRKIENATVCYGILESSTEIAKSSVGSRLFPKYSVPPHAGPAGTRRPRCVMTPLFPKLASICQIVRVVRDP